MKSAFKRAGLLALSGGLASMLVGPFLIPVPTLTGTFPARSFADDDSEFIKINGLDIHIKKLGQGEPVFVLLHGFAASLYTWNAVIQSLSELGTTIAFDRIGFGLSERPLSWLGRNPYSSEMQVDLVIELLDHFGVSKAILIGHSAGGAVSIQVALAHPDRISALILVDPAVYLSDRLPWVMKHLLATPQMRHLGPLLARYILKRGEDLIRQAWHNPALLTPEIRSHYLRPYQVDHWDKALWEFTLASQPTRLIQHICELNLPILVITGDDDRIIPTRDSIRLAGELPNATLEMIVNTGHIPHEEQPTQFMEAVESFLGKLYSEQTAPG